MTAASRRLLHRVIRYGGLFVLVLVLGLGVVGWWLWEDAPSYYRPLTFDDAAAAERAAERAERFEYRTTARLTEEPVNNDDRTLTLRERQVNEWLATRLQPWALNQNVTLPDWLGQPMVVFQPGRVLLTAHVRRSDFDQVVTLVYEPARGDGRDQPVAMHLTRVVSGRLPLPADWVLDRVFAAIDLPPERRAAVRDRLERLPLRLELDGDRVVEARTVAIEAGRLCVRWRVRR